MLTLTPLSQIAAVPQAVRDALQPYWITSAEELLGTARASNAEFGTGLAALAPVLRMPQPQLRELLREVQAALPPASDFDDALVPLRVGTGAILDEEAEPDASSFRAPVDLPHAVALNDAMPPPAQQGPRNTCVAFAVLALYQFATGDFSDLSEQFVYWACKERDRIPHIGGTRPSVAFAVLRELGVCREAVWPYNSTPTPGAEGQGPPPPAALQDAAVRRIRSMQQLPARDVRLLQAALAERKPVLIGLTIREHWTTTWQARVAGRVRAPLPGEAEAGGHALALFGYRDDPAAPGGGYFIARNSWGTSWATSNPDGAGYCHIPYRLIGERNIVAYTLEAEPAAPAPPPTATEPTATSVTLAQVEALYQEARNIRDQMNTTVEQLAVLVHMLRTLR